MAHTFTPHDNLTLAQNKRKPFDFASVDGCWLKLEINNTSNFEERGLLSWTREQCPYRPTVRGLPLSTSGGGRGSKNRPILRTKYYRSADKVGGGPKIRKFCGRHLSIAPMANFGQVPPEMFIAKLAKVHCFLSMFIHMPLPIPDLVANLCNSFRKCCDCSPIITRIHCDSLTPLRRLVA